LGSDGDKASGLGLEGSGAKGQRPAASVPAIWRRLPYFGAAPQLERRLTLQDVAEDVLLDPD
jgi:hypothetical protein